MGKFELTMDPVQEWGEEVEEGAVYGITLRREPEQLPTDPTQAQSAFSFVQYRTCKVRRLKAATLGRLVTHLRDPRCQEPDYVHIFLSTYRAFTSPDKFLGLLFQKEYMIIDDGSSDDQRSSLHQLIQTWLDQYRGDFREPPQYPSLRLLSGHLRADFHLRHLAQRAEILLKKFQDEELDSYSQATLEEQPRDEGSGDEGPECETEDERDFLAFPSIEIAEQLTRLDAELFVKVVPFQCLGCVWSQRDKDESLCSTVRATVAQFNAVTNRVITTLLRLPASTRSPTPGPAQRARVIEKWIRVAQDCRQLKNFSSLKAILSALQSNAIYRLKKTWATVCRESMAAFNNLCETFSDENCVLTSREILMEDEGSPPGDNSSPKSPKRLPISRQMSTTGGSIPYLGTYLSALTMLDTALPNTVEGGLINFEKRRREFKVLAQICHLQASCCQYALTPHPQVTHWLLDHKLLNDQESYELSQELEHPVEPCPSSPTHWSHWLLAKKLSSLLIASDGLSSLGSSGSETEDLSSPRSTSPLRAQSLSSSCHNVGEAFSSASAHASFASNSQPDLSEVPAPTAAHSTSRPTPQHKRSASMNSLPLYNRQVADCCIVRVSVEHGNNGNMYKSILLTSQDKTPQVIQRALEKHNLEPVNCHNFTLSQVLPQDKELLIPDKANVFYAMSTSANYDFVLRQCQEAKQKPGGSSSSPIVRGGRNAV